MMPTGAHRYLDHVRDILSFGYPGRSRNRSVTEMVAKRVSFDMEYPAITVEARHLNYSMMFGEAEWILSGSNWLDHHPIIHKMWSPYSDDSKTLAGAYGPPFVDQLHYVLDTLLNDEGSRQAVMAIWSKKPEKSKDIPCTITLQFLIRHHYLHVIANMRSSDAWLGIPYDIFSFSMMGQLVRLHLKKHGTNLKIGNLFIMIGSAHVYDDDLEKVDKMLNTPVKIGKYKDMSLSEFNDPVELIEWLRDNRDNPERFLI